MATSKKGLNQATLRALGSESRDNRSCVTSHQPSSNQLSFEGQKQGLDNGLGGHNDDDIERLLYKLVKHTLYRAVQNSSSMSNVPELSVLLTKD